MNGQNNVFTKNSLNLAKSENENKVYLVSNQSDWFNNTQIKAFVYKHLFSDIIVDGSLFPPLNKKCLSLYFTVIDITKTFALQRLFLAILTCLLIIKRYTCNCNRVHTVMKNLEKS